MTHGLLVLTCAAIGFLMNGVTGAVLGLIVGAVVPALWPGGATERK